ncbi:MalY/PatB family protein [Rhizobium sp. SSA_523]|uniref:MalY/PatB family protein n=1 Tax=Rhizobium sp. SSA_523 TaxID=2952477 RepID=UPI0020919F2E|nr:PatB family C-S lyase [Rhizobium sp. SSA_523]MCO5732216.1 PatB family C-S lyase [Rhizobium sp. SSA_523]WKC21373.1 PatB family C-S lyase [Rhizobium sp. SSA_523]
MTDFDVLLERRGTGSSKWSRYGEDVLPMWVADMDFPSAPEIVRSITQRLEHPVLGYGVARDELRDQIVADLADKYQWTIAREDIVFLPGVEPGFNMALRAMLAPGDSVVVQTPMYRPILNAPGHWGLTRQDAPLRASPSGFVMDEAELSAKLALSKALLFCNPHNPTGKVFTREELSRIAELCETKDQLIISDEIHCDLLFDQRRHIPLASLSQAAANRTITLMAASKTYNIAGLKTAFAIVQNPAIREKFAASRLGMVDSVNILGLEATLAAYRHGASWKNELLAYLQANRDYLMQNLSSRLPAIRCLAPEGTFLAWLDCSGLGTRDPQAFFLDKGKVAFSAGHEFGPDYGQYVRFNFGCPRSILEEGLRRMETAIATAGHAGASAGE